jgi:hypothetical protein
MSASMSDAALLIPQQRKRLQHSSKSKDRPARRGNMRRPPVAAGVVDPVLGGPTFCEPDLKRKGPGDGVINTALTIAPVLGSLQDFSIVAFKKDRPLVTFKKYG